LKCQLIDSNVFFGPWPKKKHYHIWKVDDLIKEMQAFNVEKALAISRMALTASADLGNKITVETAEQYEELIPAWVLLPEERLKGISADKTMQMMKDGGAKAGYFFPRKQGHLMKKWVVGSMLKSCEDHCIPVFLPIRQVGWNDIHEICSEFPELRVCLTGLNYREDRKLYPLLKLHRELRVALFNYIPEGGVERVTKRYGSHRLFFGSGLPDFSPGPLVSFVTYTDLSDQEKHDILRGNLEQLIEEVEL